MNNSNENDKTDLNIDSIETNHLEGYDLALRPKKLSDFIGQPQVQKNLSTFIKAAASRNEPMDHILLYGAPGLGKTTLAHIISSELNVGIRTSSGPIINKTGDLAAILTNLQPNPNITLTQFYSFWLKKLKKKI